MAERRVHLRSSDGEMFEVDETVALQMKAVKDAIECVGADAPIPLPNVSGKVLEKVVQYCEYHVESQKTSEDAPAISEAEIKAWDAQFMRLDHETLLRLMSAANYLNIENLLELTCQKVADRIKDRSSEEIGTLFNIKKDYTKEEEERIRRENEWSLT